MRVALAVAVACLALGGIAAANDAKAAIRKSTDIPTGGLGPALAALAEEFDFQVLYRTEVVGKLRTQGASGELTAGEALEHVLGGTGLTYRYLDEKTVTIIPAGSAVPEARSATATATSQDSSGEDKEDVQKKSFWGRFRVAQVDQGQGSSASAVGGGASSSQESPKSPVEIEEVIVTAQKRAEKLRDVPVSISVLSGSDLDKSTAQGMTELLGRVPGVAADEFFLGGSTLVRVRGVTAGNALFAGSSPVAYYLDSIPFGFVKSAIAPDLDAYDLERVEILRGPQGTLYGASALNGVVRVLTEDASLDEFQVKSRVATSSTEDGGWNYRGDLAVNAPIIEGKLGARAVAGFEHLSGWIDEPNRNLKDVNDGSNTNLRLKINSQPTEALSISAFTWFSRSDYGAPSGSLDDSIRLSKLAEPIDTAFDAYGFTAQYDFTAFSVKSMTGYVDFTNDSLLDLGTLGASGVRLLTALGARTFSEEFNINSTLVSAWRWSLGGIYRDSTSLLLQRLPPVLPKPTTDTKTVSQSYAVFGELTRLLFDNHLELTAGLRYFEDRVNDEERAFPVAPSNVRFSNVSPRAVVTWHPAGQMTLYASYAEGFRSGVPQNGNVIAAAPQIPSASPDKLRNYELGTKGSFLDRRVDVDAAIYYINWKDVQQQIIVPAPGNPVGIVALVNGQSASGMGVDFGVSAQVSDGLVLGTNLGWNDLKMDANVLSGGVVLFDKGDRLNLSPEWTLGASADYSFPLGSSGYSGKLSVSANYTSQQDFSSIVVGVRETGRGDNMLISRASFSVNAASHWMVTVYGDNLNNESGAPYRQLGVAAPDWAPRVRPRTVGMQLEYHL